MIKNVVMNNQNTGDKVKKEAVLIAP